MYDRQLHKDFKDFESARQLQSNHIMCLGGATESDGFVTIALSSPTKLYNLVYSKAKKKGVIGHIKIPDTNYCLRPPVNVYNNKFVTVVEPFLLVDNNEGIEKYPVLKELKSDDNPCIVIFSFKEF